MPEVPSVSRAPGLTPVDAAFADGGPLAQAIDQFEPRAGQRRMAREVETVLAGGGILIAEAGTGTGKTMAYLVPAILSGQRVLISTGTKNLQEQIYFKDLPALAAALPVKFRATYMKGRANYLCLHRLDQARASRDAGPDGLDRLVGGHDRHRRSRRARRPARRQRAVERGRRHGGNVSGQRLSAVSAVLRHAHAPARGRIRHRHRQSPSALRRRGGAPELVRRGDPRLPAAGARRGASARGRGHAVLRPVGQQLPPRRARARHRAAAEQRCRGRFRRRRPARGGSRVRSLALVLRQPRDGGAHARTQRRRAAARRPGMVRRHRRRRPGAADGARRPRSDDDARRRRGRSEPPAARRTRTRSRSRAAPRRCAITCASC